MLSLFGQKKQQPEKPLVVFILSYNRPTYLWVCLDSLYRHTGYPAKFIIADNNSPDPQVRDVIKGFERRGMFHQVYMCDDNRPDRVQWMMDKHRDELGDMFAFVESDVEVLPGKQGWLRTMRDILMRHPNMMMVGSRCDASDFIDPTLARQIDPQLTEEQVTFLTKAQSPERFPVEGRQELVEPHNPPGRLLLFRTGLLQRVGYKTDFELYKAAKSAGYEAKISTEVRHRHLSLLNFFDYSNYDYDQRNRFMNALDAGKATLSV